MPALSAHDGQRAAEFHCVVWSRRMSAPRSDRRTGSDEPLRVAVPGELSRSGDRVSTCLGSRPIGPSGFDAYRRLAIDQPLLRGDLLVSRRLYGRAGDHDVRRVSIPRPGHIGIHSVADRRLHQCKRWIAAADDAGGRLTQPRCLAFLDPQVAPGLPPEARRPLNPLLYPWNGPWNPW